MKFLGSKKLSSDRIELRPQTMEEQHYLWEVLMMPEVNKYYLTVPKKFADKLKSWEKQEPFYQRSMETANDKTTFKWSIFLKETNECIGQVSCQDGEDENNKASRDVGWYIDPKFHGKGYGSEAAKLMIDYMFSECEIDEIITGAAIVNPASWHIMEKLGFKKLEKTRFIEYTYIEEPIEDYYYIMTKDMYFNNK